MFGIKKKKSPQNKLDYKFNISSKDVFFPFLFPGREFSKKSRTYIFIKFKFFDYVPNSVKKLCSSVVLISYIEFPEKQNKGSGQTFFIRGL